MKIVDLFAGCGGMSLGFEMAGCEVLLASERDAWAADTYERNHQAGTVMIRGDVQMVKDWTAVLHEAYSDNVAVDGVVGGPPCQGFSLSGSRDKNDPRNSLFMEFVRCVRELGPRFFVMENVPGLLSMKLADRAMAIDIIRDEFAKAGYKSCYSLLNAAYFGVPQLRERVFIVGVREDVPLDSRRIFPRPSHSPEEVITVDDAISDLPPVESGEGEESQHYHAAPRNGYQAWARARSSGVTNHVAMRHTARLIERFKVIRHGQSVADVPEEHSALKRGNPKVKSGKVFSQNNMRVHGDAPAPTVAASFQSNFIHPHLHRNFTAREAARLQSFPDDYLFLGKRTTMSWEKNLSQYQQIGNAVPPLLAKAIGDNLREYFSSLAVLQDNGQRVRLRQLGLFS